jgi:hypothetical protein
VNAVTVTVTVTGCQPLATQAAGQRRPLPPLLVPLPPLPQRLLVTPGRMSLSLGRLTGSPAPGPGGFEVDRLGDHAAAVEVGVLPLPGVYRDGLPGPDSEKSLSSAGAERRAKNGLAANPLQVPSQVQCSESTSQLQSSHWHHGHSGRSGRTRKPPAPRPWRRPPSRRAGGPARAAPGRGPGRAARRGGAELESEPEA